MVFAILPPAHIQVAILVIISRKYGEKSINNVSPINEAVWKVRLFVRPFKPSFTPSFRQTSRLSKAQNPVKGKNIVNLMRWYIFLINIFHFAPVSKIKFGNYVSLKASLQQFFWNLITGNWCFDYCAIFSEMKVLILLGCYCQLLSKLCFVYLYRKFML